MLDVVERDDDARVEPLERKDASDFVLVKDGDVGFGVPANVDVGSEDARCAGEGSGAGVKCGSDCTYGMESGVHGGGRVSVCAVECN